MAAPKVAPKDQLPSLTALNSLIAELKATEHAVLRGAAGAAAAAVGGDAKAAAAAAAPRKKVGHDSPSLGVDFSWYPAVPLGHTAYSWGADDTDADVKLSNVFAKHEHHYVGKHSHDSDAKDGAAAPAPAPAAAAPAKAAAPAAAAAAADKPKDDKKGGDKGKAKGGDDKKKGGAEDKPKGDDKKKGDDKNAKKAEAKPKADDKKKDDKKKGGAAKPEVPKPTAAAGSVGVFARLDIRAGKIVKAWKHPKADKLYVEEIDVGEPKPRTIVSGLVEHVPLDQFQGATVCVICNLKPADMRGQMSYGMVLAASNDNRKTVELVSPAEGSKPGDRVALKGEPSTADAKAVDAEVDLFAPGNAWIDAKDFLKTDANCHAQYNGKPMVTAAGPARSKTKANANIS